MINLLPPQTRKDIGYARKNSVLVHWLFVLVIALVGVAIIIASGLFYLDQTTKSYVKRSAALTESLKNQNIEDTQKKVDEISNNVKLTTQVLSKEILFSKLLKQLGAALPNNSALAQLQIDSLQGGIALNASAKDINSATQVQLNLQDPKNQIFEKADIESISCEQDTDKALPCSVQVRALFMKNNPFLYIAPGQGAKKQ